MLVCAGDVCLRPSQYDLDNDFDVLLRDNHGNVLDSRKLSYKAEQPSFCFENQRDGKYEIAFVLYEKGVSQPAVVFPTDYKHNSKEACDPTFMVESVCPK